MTKILRAAALLAFLAEGSLLFAQNFKEALAHATDATSGSLFLFNPAVTQAHADCAALGLVRPRSDSLAQIIYLAMLSFLL